MDQTLPLQRFRLSALMALFLTFGFGAAAHADDGSWTLRAEPVYVDVQGHNPNLLVVSGAAGGSDSVSLETGSNTGYHFELRRSKAAKKWGWGVDFFWITAAQKTPRRSSSADAGGAPLVFEHAGGSFTSSGPEEVLFFERLEDTDFNAWTVDLYALRRFSTRDLQLLLGIRNADFDNDNHAVIGIEDLGGTRIDGSSNYGRMIGPIIGLVAQRERGKNGFEFSLTQSVVQGDSVLSAMHSDFVGPYNGDSQEFIDERQFSTPKSVTIPITDLRARWRYAATRRLSFGLGAAVSHWTDVSIPPGVQVPGSLNTLQETSITFVGLLAVVEVAF